MRTIEEIKNEFNIEFDLKQGRNFTNVVYVFNANKNIENKKNRKAAVPIQASYKFMKDYKQDDYKMGSRNEDFLIDLLDCLLFENYEPEVTPEKKEMFRKYLQKRIDLNTLKSHQYQPVTY